MSYIVTDFSPAEMLPFLTWQMLKAKASVNDKDFIKSGYTDFGELNYIIYAIEDSTNPEDYDCALEIALMSHSYEKRKDLIADLYIKKGEYEKAEEVITGDISPDLYEVMAGPIEKLLKINPDLKERVMKKIEENPKYFSALRTEFYTEEIGE